MKQLYWLLVCIVLNLNLVQAKNTDTLSYPPKSTKILDTSLIKLTTFVADTLPPNQDTTLPELSDKEYSQADSLRINQMYDSEKGYEISGITLFSKPKLEGNKDKRLYYYMKWRTERIFPFYLQAIDFFDKVERQKQILTESQLDTYIDRVEDYLFANFKDTVMNMTKIEGMIFSKLIYRYTAQSLYDIIDDNMGGLSAFWWSSVASFFTIDIEEEYCPTSIKKDLWIENILIELQNENRIPYIPDAKGYCIETKLQKIEDEKAKQDTTFKWYKPWSW